MRKLYALCFSLVTVACFIPGIINAQTTVSAPGISSYTFWSETAPGVIVFGVKNNNPGDIMITELANYVPADFSGTFTLWYHPSDVVGAPTAVSTANGWIELATNTVTTTSAGFTTLFSNLNFILPVSTTYRFALSGPPRAPFYGGPGTTPNVYFAGGVEVYVQDNPNSQGYAGAFTGAPTSTPRSFIGSITFVPTATCSEPPAAGQATASRLFACSGSAISLDLINNTIGTGQSYQWQEATNLTGPYINIGSLSNSPLLTINPTSTKWYRALVTCSSGPSMESQPVEIPVVSSLPAGTYTIDNTVVTGGTNFQSFTDAINRINSCGVSGPVVFNVATNQVFNEDVPLITASGTSANTITFQKNGSGQNPKIIPLSPGTINTTSIGANGDGIIVINGGDYFTFDGIDLETNTGFSGIDMYEYGYFLKKASATNACKNIIIRNCTITLNKAQPHSYGIFVSNISGTSSITVTTTGGRSENIKIYNNTISAFGAIQTRGYTDGSPYDLYDQNIEIGVDGGNTILDFGGSNTAVFTTIFLNVNNLKIANNSILGGTGTTGTTYGIYASTTGPSDVDIYSNNISFTPSTTSSNVYGIYNGAGSTGSTIDIYNNTLSNISLLSSTSGSLYLIYQSSAVSDANIYGNTINNISKTGSSGTVNCIYNSSTAASGNLRIHNNTITNISGGSTLNGINSDPVGTTNVQINNNEIGNLSGSSVYGIVLAAGAGTQVYQNKIYDLTSTGNTAYGIHASGATSGNTYNIYNNIIGNLAAPSGSTADGVRGISVNATTATTTFNVSYNTVYLNATSSGTNFSAAGIYHTTSATATSGTLHLRNNLVYNISVSNGSGRTSAFRRSNATLANYGSESNNNVFYAGTPSSNNLIFWNGTNAIETMAAFKAHVGPRDNVSITEAVPFLNTTTGADANFLHIDPAVPTQVESGGIAVAGINNDFDGDIRHGSTGYAGTGVATDIGADEFNGTVADFTRPLITHIPLKFTCSVGDRVFTANISDAGGIPTNGALVPRVYYRKGASGPWYSQPGTLLSFDGTTGSWQFTIVAADMGGLIITDQVEYFIVAQDNAGNIASNPAGVTATSVNAVTGPPSPANIYKVSYTLSGTYTINSALPTDGSNFQTFTDAVKVCVAGPVVFNVQPGSYNEQVLIDPIAGASAINTITFNGHGQTLSWTSTNTDERAVIKFNGADYITFDNLNIVAGGSQSTEYGYGVQMVDNADHNTISNCTINVTTTPQTAASTSFAGIVINSSTSTAPITNGNSECDDNTFSGNTIIGGYYGIVLSADGGNNLLLNNNRVLNNTVQDFYSYGVYINGSNNSSIEGNDISRPSRSSIGTFYGIYVSEQSTNLSIAKNKIYNTHAGSTSATTAAYGIYFTTADATAGNENVVSNNMIYQFNSSGTQYGLYNSGSDFAKYYYNSVLLDNQTPTTNTTYDTRAFYQTTSATGIEVMNNNLVVSRNAIGENHVLYFNTAATTFTTDYNNLYLTTSAGATNSLAYRNSTQYADLASWQAAGNDANSLSTDPLFMSPTDLHIQQGSFLDDKGIAIAGIVTDIDGDARGATRTDIGADELPLAPGTDIQPILLVSPTTSSSNCYGSETITVRIKNNSMNPIDFALAPVTINVLVSGAASASYSATVSTGSLAAGAELSVTMATPSSSMDMSAAGSYLFDVSTVVAGDINPGNDVLPQVSFTREALSAGTIGATPGGYCINGGTPTLSTTGVSGYSNLQWQQSTTPGAGFTDIPGGTTNPFTVADAITQSMYYRLVASCGATSETSPEIAVLISNPQVVNTTPGVRCGPGEVLLSATGSAGATLNWYTAASGGAPVHTGSTYTTPVIDETTTYYVSALDGGLTENVGRQAPYVTSSLSTANRGIFFNATAPFTLQSVVVYPIVAGSGTIEVRSSTGTVLAGPVNVSWPAGNGHTPHILSLNVAVPAGNDMYLVMASISGNLAYEIASNFNGAYPYTSSSGVVTITGSRGTSASPSTTTYYYFYDLTISTGCESARTAVAATVNEVPDNATTLAGTNNGVQVCATYDVADANYYFSNCALIAKVEPMGGSPVAGDITSCVRIDATVQTYGNQPYVQRHYDIDPVINSATATARVTFYATQQEFDAYNDFVIANALNFPLLPASPADPNTANVRVTQFHGTGTAPGNYTGFRELHAPASVIWNAANSWWEVTIDVTGFSGFYLHTVTGSGPLPVNLYTFGGKREGNANVLSWTTASESNNQGFSVERSEDGRSYTAIGFVRSQAAGGNSTSELHYRFTDDNISGNKHYYRLKQMDNNGRHHYSNVVLIRANDAERSMFTLLALYPNPVTGSHINIMVYAPASKLARLQISDATGRLVLERKAALTTGNNTLAIPVDKLAQGTYFIRIDGHGDKTLSFIK